MVITCRVAEPRTVLVLVSLFDELVHCVLVREYTWLLLLPASARLRWLAVLFYGLC